MDMAGVSLADEEKGLLESSCTSRPLPSQSPGFPSDSDSGSEPDSKSISRPTWWPSSPSSQLPSSGMSPRWRAFLILATLLNVLLGLFSGWTMLHTSAANRAELRKEWLEEHYAYSPALVEADEMSTVRFNGTLRAASRFRGTPSPAIDAAWAELTDLRPMAISAAEMQRLGKSEVTGVQFPPELGGGYLATLEMNHQLHCLNLLRKATQPEYYATRDPAWLSEDEPGVTRTHIDHCIEALRQLLVCNGDLGVVTHVWVKGYPRPYPDFNIEHRCRAGAWPWVRAHQSDMFSPDQIKKPADGSIVELDTWP